MINDIFNYYKDKYKTEWLPNGDVDIYNKNTKKEENIGFAIYFSKRNKEYVITIDTEIICVLEKKKIIFTNKTYWHQINHIHIEQDKDEMLKSNIIKTVNKYLK